MSSTSLPTGPELEIIDECLDRVGANNPVARAIAIRAFSNGDYSAETLPAWMALQQVDNKKMFPGANGAGDNAANGAGDNAGPKASNPFSKAGWNITEQGRLVRVSKDMAASLAAACGVTIGATKPNL